VKSRASRFNPAHLVVALIALALTAAGIAVYFAAYPLSDPLLKQSETYDSTKETLARLTGIDYQRYFTEHIHTFYTNEGINGMIRRTEKAMADGQITMFVCHSLAHDIGHYAGYADNLSRIEEYLSADNLNFCGSGFMHGMEGQIAYEAYPDNVNDLYALCKMMLPFHPYYYGCYHGAGHAFMEMMRDEPAQAMALCDRLKTDEEVDVTHCYRGVFSEYANYLHGQQAPRAAILDYCDSLTGELRTMCAEETNGLELPITATVPEIKEALSLCLKDGYDRIIQIGCVRSIGGIATDRELGTGRLPSTEPLSILDEELAKNYIETAFGAYIKTALLNPALSFEPFCDALSSDALKTYCKALIASKHFTADLQH
jgi:hypothetical protein